MGTNKIEVKTNSTDDYSAPVLFSAGTENGINSGGQTYVQGWYFSWESATGGFVNTSWWATEDEDGPTRTGGFTDESLVISHITNGGNLDNAFASWQTYLNNLDNESAGQAIIVFNDFLNRLIEKNGAGCGTRYQ